MSYTTVLSLTIGQGSAPYVWNEMCKKYFGTADFMYYDCIDKLWPIYKNKEIPEHHRAVLMMTYDMAFVSKNNFIRAAKDIRLFIKDFPINISHTNHWNSIAKIYEDENLDCEAIGLWCTSVSENPFEGDWNEELEKYDCIDWEESTDIYKTLDSI